jgi:hypothetical protein
MIQKITAQTRMSNQQYLRRRRKIKSQMKGTGRIITRMGVIMRTIMSTVIPLF